jgi:16S rRNA (adenine1518-N6/adenine1519-N6)-dimethyltransferase
VSHYSSPNRPSKRLGQNFLVDPSIAREIVSSAHVSRSDTVLEPGPGHGTLTRLLQNVAGRVIAVEKDPWLARELKQIFEHNRVVVIVEGDVLKIELPQFNKVVSTPPYYLSSKLVVLLAKSEFETASLVFQKEFGQRLIAEPGTPEYGRLTVLSQRNFVVEKIREVPRTVFRPRPKVDSVLLTLSAKEKGEELNEALFEEMVRGIFTQRRRLLRAALLHFLSLKFGRETGKSMMSRIPVLDARVYQLSVEDLERLCRALSDALIGQNY